MPRSRQNGRPSSAKTLRFLSNPGTKRTLSRPTPLGEPLRGVVHPDAPHAPQPDTVADTTRARRWFDILRWGASEDLYTYQQPLTSRSGPRVAIRGRSFLMLSSYDYLGLIGHPAIDKAAIDAIQTYGTSTGGVRLLTGTNDLHQQFEDTVATFQETEAALTFSSGYAANLAAIAALAGPGDTVYTDALVHRSAADACKLSGARIERFAHNRPEQLEAKINAAPPQRRALIVIEGIYSMEGDIGCLPAFVEIKNRYGAFLMVDEAHSVGVLGKTGRGVDEYFGLAPDSVDVWTGSLSKALAAPAGYIAGSRELIVYLQHEAAPFIFSAALAPAACAAATAAIKTLAQEPERLTRMRANAERLRHGLATLGYQVGTAPTPVIPVQVGNETAAYRLARALWELRAAVTAVVYPAVPRGGARLRVCVTAAHAAQDIDDAIGAFADIAKGADHVRATAIA